MSTESKAAQRAPWRARAVSGGESLLGALIVIGHNVYRVVPNEVPILVALAIVSMRWRERAWSWASLGFKRPARWRDFIVIALAAAVLRLLSGYGLETLTAHFWPPIKAPAGTSEIRGHLTLLLQWLLIVWVFAGVGEEIVYRGYLLNKLADALGRTRLAELIAVLGSAALFGLGHYYKGPAGILDSGVAGVILGAAYLISGRNLWTCVLAHGLIDTFGLTAVYLGWGD